MKALDRLLKIAADMHAKRNPGAPLAPKFMPFTVPDRHPKVAPCDLCATTFDELDRLGLTQPPGTDAEHFLDGIGAWWFAACLAANNQDIKKTVESYFRILRAHGVPAVMQAMPMTQGGDRAH